MWGFDGVPIIAAPQPMKSDAFIHLGISCLRGRQKGPRRPRSHYQILGILAFPRTGAAEHERELRHVDSFTVLRGSSFTPSGTMNDYIDKRHAATVKWRRSTVPRQRDNRECGAEPDRFRFSMPQLPPQL